MQVVEVINAVQRTLGDIPLGEGAFDGDRWTFSELLAYVNSGIADIASRTTVARVQPAYTKHRVIKLQPGATQNLIQHDPQTLRLLDVESNMGTLWIAETLYKQGAYVYYMDERYYAKGDITDLNTPPETNLQWELTPSTSGNAPQQIAQENLTALIPNWKTAQTTSTAPIQYWAPEQHQDTQFWVYPPQALGAESPKQARQYVRVHTATVPAALETATDEIPLARLYVEPLQLYVLARAFAKSGTADISARAALYMQLYTNSSIFLI